MKTHTADALLAAVALALFVLMARAVISPAPQGAPPIDPPGGAGRAPGARMTRRRTRAPSADPRGVRGDIRIYYLRIAQGDQMNKLGQIIRAEFAHSIGGVEGRMSNAIGGVAPGTFSNQKFLTGWKEYHEDGERMRIRAEVRFDDECRNGRNSFAITGETQRHGGRWVEDSGGCIHEEIAKRFPELAHLIKWHLSDSRGPIAYESNTAYLAGDRDYNGLREGERRQIRNGKTGKLSWRLEQPGEPAEYVDSDTCPPPPEPARYVPWCREGKGKERQLDAARRAAVWPEATDAELCAEPDALRAALQARLPALLVDMRQAIEGAGFLWECPQ